MLTLDKNSDSLKSDYASYNSLIHLYEENQYCFPLFQPQGVEKHFNLCWFQAQIYVKA